MTDTVASLPDAWNLFKVERTKAPNSVSLIAFAKVCFSKCSIACHWGQIDFPTAIDSINAGGAKVEEATSQVDVPSNGD